MAELPKGMIFRYHSDDGITIEVTATPLVQCKDCKHLFDGEHNTNCCELLMEKAKWTQEITVDENWFCADGERKEQIDALDS